MRTQDLKGKKFGRWTVLEFAGLFREGLPTRGTSWKCACDCGRVIEKVRSSYLLGGKSNSCGCLRREFASTRHRTHGFSRTERETYLIWMGVKTRCYNLSHPSSVRYGQRGIKMSDEWKNDFARFLADMGRRPSLNHSIERIDNDGPYCKENCRWATRSEQMSNTRRTKFFEWKGQARTLTEICRMEDVRYINTRNRIFIMGLTLEDAITDTRNTGLGYVERAACRGGSDAPLTSQKKRRRPKPPRPMTLTLANDP